MKNKFIHWYKDLILYEIKKINKRKRQPPKKKELQLLDYKVKKKCSNNNKDKVKKTNLKNKRENDDFLYLL